MNNPPFLETMALSPSDGNFHRELGELAWLTLCLDFGSDTKSSLTFRGRYSETK